MNPLDQLRIASPCTMSWDAMKGDDRRRFCGACKLNVYDLSNLEAKEALDLVRRSEGGRVCMRFWRRKDGTVITADCPVGIADRARRRVRTLAKALVVLMLTLVGGVAFAHTETGSRIVDRVHAFFSPPPDPPVPMAVPPGQRVVMGEVALPDPPPVQQPK